MLSVQPGTTFAFCGNGLVEVSARRLLRLPLAQVGLDPPSSYHDTGLVLLRDVDLPRRVLAKEVEGRGGKGGEPQINEAPVSMIRSSRLFLMACLCFDMFSQELVSNTAYFGGKMDLQTGGRR